MKSFWSTIAVKTAAGPALECIDVLLKWGTTRLEPLAKEGLLILPTVPADCDSNYHMFYLLLRSLSERTRLIDHLKSRGILAVFHYVPLHTSPMGTAMGYRQGMLPVTEQLSERVLRLPMFYEMQDAEVMSVVTEIYNFFGIPCPAELQEHQGAIFSSGEI